TVNLRHTGRKDWQLHLWHAFSYQPLATYATIFRLILISSTTRKSPPRSGGLNVTVSLREFAIGYGLSVVLGILAGSLAGRFRTVEYALDPFLWFLYSAPLIAFYPIFVLWFGLGVPTVPFVSCTRGTIQFMNNRWRN